MALFCVTSNLKRARPFMSLLRSRSINTSSSRDVRLKLKTDAQSIFHAALGAVSPQEMVKNNLLFRQNILSIMDHEYVVDKNVSVVAFGKAVLGMTKAVEDVLGDQIVRGVASIPVGLPHAIKASGNKELIEKSTLSELSTIEIIEGAKNNLPDEMAQYAASRIKEVAESMSNQDILLVLISGGGSALLPYPVEGITLEEKLKTIKVLASRGATIHELNTVRKNLSDIKGGKLAEAAFPAKVVTLILSDVIGDPLDIIASGPTVPDPSTPADCLEIFKKLNAEEEIPDAVIQYLQQSKQKTEKQEKVKLNNFSHVQNVIIGSNRFAVDAAVKKALVLGYAPVVLSTMLSGEARDVGKMFSDAANLAWNGHLSKMSPYGQHVLTSSIVNEILTARNEQKPVCIIGAGETTVTLKGKGIGGRNQEMALTLAIDIYENLEQFCNDENNGGLVLLSAGTDGQDGPNPAAGAMADPYQITEAKEDGLDAKQFLENNDSFSFYSKFKNGRDHVVTGLTGTNVMDIQILLVSPPS